METASVSTPRTPAQGLNSLFHAMVSPTALLQCECCGGGGDAHCRGPLPAALLLTCHQSIILNLTAF